MKNFLYRKTLRNKYLKNFKIKIQGKKIKKYFSSKNCWKKSKKKFGKIIKKKNLSYNFFNSGNCTLKKNKKIFFTKKCWEKNPEMFFFIVKRLKNIKKKF